MPQTSIENVLKVPPNPDLKNKKTLWHIPFRCRFSRKYMRKFQVPFASLLNPYTLTSCKVVTGDGKQATFQRDSSSPPSLHPQSYWATRDDSDRGKVMAEPGQVYPKRVL